METTTERSSSMPFHAMSESSAEKGQTIESLRLSDNFVREKKSWLSSINQKTIICGLFMSIFAVLGTFLRIVLAQYFGQECQNPGTVGWLAASSPLCVTANGSSQEGGIIFADLPANMLGCFFMGILQSGTILNLATNLPIAWLPKDNAFQSWDIIHLAMKTGFCGSLTTYSSWNSEMIIMIFGAAENKQSQWVRALLGYIIGVETAMGSFHFGKSVAIWLHRYTNPLLAEEANILSKKNDICVNKNLPCFERRFLSSLFVQDYNSDIVQELKKWRDSTMEKRRINSTLLDTIHTIEENVLVHNKDPGVNEEEIAAENGFNLSALCKYNNLKNLKNRENHDLQIFSNPLYAFSVFASFFIPIFILVFTSNGDDTFTKTRVTAIYAGLIAPCGALLRWSLSSYNGYLAGELSWVPLGTFSANMIGSTISILMIALELRFSNTSRTWSILLIRAVKIGFSGSLTTVSTFVAEVSKLLFYFPNQMLGYSYILLSLGSSCILGSIVYGLATINL